VAEQSNPMILIIIILVVQPTPRKDESNLGFRVHFSALRNLIFPQLWPEEHDSMLVEISRSTLTIGNLFQHSTLLRIGSCFGQVFTSSLIPDYEQQNERILPKCLTLRSVSLHPAERNRERREAVC
jgi:hypothetical protein